MFANMHTQGTGQCIHGIVTHYETGMDLYNFVVRI